MAGITVGGTTDDWVLNSATGAALRRASKLRWYAAATGGSPLTLTYNGQSVTEIPVPAGGFYPEHTWPDGIASAYAVALEDANATEPNFTAAARIKHVPPGTGGGGGVTDYADLTGKPTFAAVATSGSKADVGLSNVDNTADTAKPVSTAQQTALNGKLAKDQNLADLPSSATARTNLGVDKFVKGDQAGYELVVAPTQPAGLTASQIWVPTDASTLVKPGSGGTYIKPQVGWWAYPSGYSGATTATPTASRAFYNPIWLEPGTYDALACQITTARVGGTTTLSVGLYPSTTGGLPDTTAVIGTGTVTTTAAGAPVTTLNTPAVITTAGQYWIAYLYVVTSAATTAPVFIAFSGNPGYAVPSPSFTAFRSALIRDAVTSLPTTASTTSNLTVANTNTGPDLPILFGIRRSA